MQLWHCYKHLTILLADVSFCCSDVRELYALSIIANKPYKQKRLISPIAKRHCIQTAGAPRITCGCHLCHLIINECSFKPQ